MARTDATARVAKKSKQSMMVAKSPGGDPVQPAASPTTTQPMGKIKPTSKVTTKKVAKVKVKKIARKPLKRPTVKKRMKD